MTGDLTKNNNFVVFEIGHNQSGFSLKLFYNLTSWEQDFLPQLWNLLPIGLELSLDEQKSEAKLFFKINLETNYIFYLGKLERRSFLEWLFRTQISSRGRLLLGPI